MLKHIAIVTFLVGTSVCVNHAAAGEMAMPGGTFTTAGGGSGEVDTSATAIHGGTASAAGMHETASHTAENAAHVRVQPDSTAEPRTDSAHAAVGTDAAAPTENGTPPAHHRPRAHWQSLLPGVMK